MSVENQNEERELLSTIELVRLLYAQKWLICAGAVLIGVLVAFYSLTKANSFESTAALIIRQPQAPIPSEPAPLTVEMLQLLTESADVKTELFDKAKETEIFSQAEATSVPLLQQGASLDLFQRSLSTAIETGSRRRPGNEPPPLLKLKARSKNPEDAAGIVNLWANIVTKRTKKIYWDDVEEVNTFMSKLSTTTEAELTTEENAYTTLLLSTQLAINQASLVSTTNTFRVQFQEHLKITTELNQKEAMLNALNASLLEQRSNGSWVGDMLAQCVLKGEPMETDEMSTYSLRIWGTLNEIKRNEDLLVVLEQNSRLQFLEMEKKTMEASLSEVTIGIVDANNQLAQMETEHAELVAQLANLPEKIELSKVLPEEWSVSLTIAELVEQGAQLMFKSEIVNPVHFAVKQKVVNMAGQIEGISSRADYYEDEKVTLKDDVTSLTAKITKIQEEKEALTNALTANKETLVHMRTEFQKDRNQVATLEGEIAKLKTQQAAANKQINELTKAIGELEIKVFNSKMALDAQQRRVQDLRQARANVAAPAQEVAQLVASAEQASRSGATILFEGKPNPQKVGPARRKMVMTGMAAGFALCCFLVIGMRLIREN